MMYHLFAVVFVSRTCAAFLLTTLLAASARAEYHAFDEAAYADDAPLLADEAPTPAMPAPAPSPDAAGPAPEPAAQFYCQPFEVGFLGQGNPTPLVCGQQVLACLSGGAECAEFLQAVTMSRESCRITDFIDDCWQGVLGHELGTAEYDRALRLGSCYLCCNQDGAYAPATHIWQSEGMNFTQPSLCECRETTQNEACTIPFFFQGGFHTGCIPVGEGDDQQEMCSTTLHAESVEDLVPCSPRQDEPFTSCVFPGIEATDPPSPTPDVIGAAATVSAFSVIATLVAVAFYAWQ